MKNHLLTKGLILFFSLFLLINVEASAQNSEQAQFLEYKDRSLIIELQLSERERLPEDGLAALQSLIEVRLDEIVLSPLSLSSPSHEGKDSLSSQKILVTAPLPDGFIPNRYSLDFIYKSKILIEDQPVRIPHLLTSPDEQPRLIKGTTLAVTPGEPFEIIGKNFGDDLNKVYVALFDHNYKDSLINANIMEYGPIYADYLSKPNAQGEQSLIFQLPSMDRLDYFTTHIGLHPFGNNINGQVRAKVFVNHQPSPNFVEFSVIKQGTHRLIRLIISLVPAMFLLAIVLILMIQRVSQKDSSKLSFLQQMLIDQATNTYSIAKCQAFAWTVALGAGYLVLSISSFIYLNRTQMPDFDVSLVWLMGISYGGAAVARSRDSSRPKNRKKLGQPSWKDLFMDSEGISLSRAQHVVFTVIALGLFCFYMADPKVLNNGLPKIPTTLLALMGVSQGGYIGEKFARARLSVLDVHLPASCRFTYKDSTMVLDNSSYQGKSLFIYGSGFAPGTKVMADKHAPKNLVVEVQETMLKAHLEKFIAAGSVTLTILTPDGNMLTLRDVFEIKGEAVITDLGSSEG